MKFNFKKSAKYIICTLLTLTVVATVVFLPRFYYSVTDNGILSETQPKHLNLPLT